MIWPESLCHPEHQSFRHVDLPRRSSNRPLSALVFPSSHRTGRRCCHRRSRPHRSCILRRSPRVPPRFRPKLEPQRICSRPRMRQRHPRISPPFRSSQVRRKKQVVSPFCRNLRQSASPDPMQSTRSILFRDRSAGDCWAFPLLFFSSKSGITRYLKLMENSATSPTVTLDDSNFEKEVTQSDQTVLVDFWAPWCGPCKMIAPLLDEIATEKAGSVKVAKVNVDENQSLSVKYNVRAIPALLFFKNGQLRDQVVGMTTRKDLLGRLDALA